jgi:hypothetical protein
MSMSAARMLADTKRCSVAKRLPPPWAGRPVKVPQPVKAKEAKVTQMMGVRHPVGVHAGVEVLSRIAMEIPVFEAKTASY